MKKTLILSFALVFAVMLNAQEKIEEGVLTIKQSMSSDNEQMNLQLKSMGELKNATSYFKGDKSRNETSNPMAGDMTMIIDGATQQMLMLMDNPSLGKKYTIQSTVPSESDLESVTVKKGEETKTVLGYECQQYIINMKQNGQEVEMHMFTTDKISALSQNTTAMAGKVEGYPLYFVMKLNQMGAVIEVSNEVIKIDKVAVSDDKFSMTPPEGYTKMEGM
ncbi:DUF4412 domain-containing protein [Winogradskyella vidalii]|uniref:DUF4412 domain-containing protein n=1 Tax=Winogradskyella vidalii TaxID=2615024 RepID=UPI0015CCCE00|nr:DUF4412 domain-containing protein [Winogradskyella vidalii]